jgi:hypothetical protein
MSQKLREEQERFKALWRRLSIIRLQHPERYGNKNDVMEEALDALEAKLALEP